MKSNQQVSHTKKLLESNKDTEKNVPNAIKISSPRFQDEVARLSAEFTKSQIKENSARETKGHVKSRVKEDATYSKSDTSRTMTM